MEGRTENEQEPCCVRRRCERLAFWKGLEMFQIFPSRIDGMNCVATHTRVANFSLGLLLELGLSDLNLDLNLDSDGA